MAGRWSWRSRTLAIAGAAAAAAFALIGVRWEQLGARPENTDSGPAVLTSPGALPAEEIPPPLPGNDSSVAADTRWLILSGTLVAVDPADSRAFLGVDPKNPQTYAVNSLLVNGTRILTIARDHVMLERDGRVVRLDIGSAFSEPAPEARRLTVVLAADAKAALAEQPRDPAISDVLGVSPVFDANGALTSYRLRPGRQGGAFVRWGLEPGDQLVAIEGTPLSDTDSAAFMLELVGRGERVHGTVLRSGTRVAVVLDGSVIAEEKTRLRAASESLMSAPSG
jgi:type II secretion system protein C